MATPVRSEAARVETIAFGSMSRLSFARSSLACSRLALSRIVPHAVGKPDPSDMLSMDRQGRDEPEILLHEPASEPVGLHG